MCSYRRLNISSTVHNIIKESESGEIAAGKGQGWKSVYGLRSTSRNHCEYSLPCNPQMPNPQAPKLFQNGLWLSGKLFCCQMSWNLYNSVAWPACSPQRGEHKGLWLTSGRLFHFFLNVVLCKGEHKFLCKIWQFDSPISFLFFLLLKKKKEEYIQSLYKFISNNIWIKIRRPGWHRVAWVASQQADSQAGFLPACFPPASSHVLSC